MPSAVEFSRRFSRVLSETAQVKSSETRLFLLLGLWPEIEPLLAQPQYSSFVDEYQSSLKTVVVSQSLRNLTEEELAPLTLALTKLNSPDKLALVALQRARIIAFVGDPVGAAAILSTQYNETADLAAFDTVSLGANEHRRLELAIAAIESSAPKTAAALKIIHAGWQADAGALHHDCAWCLWVETGPHLTQSRGSMHQLSGQVDITGTGAERENGNYNDRVAFAHQLTSPDDPAVGGVYRALAAVRTLLEADGLARTARTHAWSVQYLLADNDHRFTGDSLSLAAALVAYGCILKSSEVLRYERVISGEVGFTGNLDADGRLEPVNARSLHLKIDRAFFSHLRYLVIPMANRDDAERILAGLTAKYPRRRLQLVAAETLAEVAGDHNVVRPEKLCPGVYAGKMVRKYTRSTAVQVPLLTMLAYILLCIVYPPAWILFDDNPVAVRLAENRSHLEVVNADNYILWSINFPIDTTSFSRDTWEAANIDDDTANEIMITTSSDLTGADTTIAQLHAYDDDGTRLWRRSCVLLREYVGDTLETEYYQTAVGVVETSRGVRIWTTAFRSYPARTHFILWSATGERMSSYINQGASTLHAKTDLDRDGLAELVFTGYNNRTKTAVCFLLPDTGFSGVSPPYVDEELDLSWIQHGTQTQYIVFLPTDVTKAWRGAPYSSGGSVYVEGNDILRVMVFEPAEARSGLDYYIDSTLRVFSVKPDDSFLRRRDALIKDGTLPPAPLDAYLGNQLDSARYWTDSGWVTEGQLRSQSPAP